MTNSLILSGRGSFRTSEGIVPGEQIFATLASAENYALTSPNARPGMILVVTGAPATTAYLIQQDRTLVEIGGGGGVGTVETVNLVQVDPGTTNITLTGEHLPFDRGGYSTMYDALASLFYTKPAVTLTGGGTYEYGRTVNTVNLSWSLTGSDPLISQSINQGIGSVPVGTTTYSHTGQSITADRTYTITVDDGKNTATGSTTVAFRARRYWGTSANETLTDANILALSSELSTTRVQSNRIMDCTGGKYIWFVWEASYGTGTFTVNGLLNSAFTGTTRTMVNVEGVTRTVLITRSNTLLFGSNYNVSVT